MPRGMTEKLEMSKAINWLVMVVPRLAPRIIPIDCLKFRALAFIKMMVRIITAEEEPIKTVTTIPTNKESQLFLVY